VQIELSPAEAPWAGLLDRSLDVALLHSSPRDRRLLTVPLFDDQIVLLASSAHRVALKSYVEATDLRDEHVLNYSPTGAGIPIVDQIFRPGQVTPARVSAIPLVEAILQMVGTGLGVTVLPRWVLTAPPGAPNVVAVPITKQGTNWRWRAVTLQAAVEPHVARFVELMRIEGLRLQSARTSRAKSRASLVPIVAPSS
jgi:LysR family transcriptional regulator for metE and metH